MMRHLLIVSLLVLGGCATAQQGIVSEKNFCYGICSWTPERSIEHEPAKLEPLELTIKVDRVDPIQDECSKENPDACIE